ncbi:ricin B, lectin domain, glycoside hydrolase [Tanacetum coccineum]
MGGIRSRNSDEPGVEVSFKTGGSKDMLDRESILTRLFSPTEYVAAAQASKEAVWLKMLLEELGHEQEKITLFCDNQSALYLARNPAFHSKTKHIRVNKWNLTVAKDGVKKYNPEILEMSVVEAQNTMVNELGKGGLMVVLHNHVSLSWCCGDNDGNGFFGDEYFVPNEWVQGSVAVARRYKSNPLVWVMYFRI